MKRKTSLIVWGAVLLLAAYGIYDLVREVRRSYTSCYAHTYSHAIGQMMGPRFDSLTPRGEGIRIGVVDAGFGGLRDDRFTRRLRVADYLDLTDGDTTGFFRDDCDHGTRVTRNIGGFSNDTLLGLACKADYYLVKSDLEHGEPRETNAACAGPWPGSHSGRSTWSTSRWAIPYSTISTAIRRRCSTAARRSARVFSTACSMHTRAWSSYKAPATRGKQMAPHLVPRGCRRGRHGRRGRLRRHGAFGQERHRLLPAPRQA